MNAPVLSVLRQRPPFLFVDSYRVLEGDGHVEARFRFSGEESYFAGHFPGDPIVPGVLLIEAMAQAARLALAERFGRMRHGFLSTVERARFNKPVRPPEEIRVVAKLGADRDENFATAACTIFIGAARAARADITLSIQQT